MKAVLFLLLAACAGKEHAATATAAPAPQVATEAMVSATPAATIAPAATSGGGGGGLPDLTANLPHGQCEQISLSDGTKSLPGADGYFWGEYSVNGNTVTGTEKWYLFANTQWQAKGGKDCQVVWTVQGTVAKPISCTDCDLGIKATETIDTASTTCIEDIWKREKNFNQLGYDIQRKSDGTSVWFFSGSGKRMGQGYSAGSKLNFLTDHKCNWF